MPDVAGGKCRLTSKSNARYLGVANLDRPAGALTSGNEGTCSFGGCGVEWDYPSIEVFVEKSGEGRLEPMSSLGRVQQFQTRSDCQHRDRGCPDRFRWLIVEPLDNGCIRVGMHERRKDIRVEDDHGASRSATLTG